MATAVVANAAVVSVTNTLAVRHSCICYELLPSIAVVTTEAVALTPPLIDSVYSHA
jgi:hypothetical protein